MTAPAPMPVVIAAIAALCAVTLARWLLVDATLTARLVTRAAAWVSVGAVMQHCVLAAGHEAAAVQLYLFCSVLSVANIYGVAKLFVGADPAGTHDRQRRYDIMAVVGGLTAVLPGPAEGVGGADFWVSTVVSWAVFNIPLLVAGVHIARACVRDIRAEASLLTRVPYLGLLMLTTGWFVGAALMMVQAFDGKPPGALSARWSVVSSLFCVLVALIIAVPLAHMIAARTGLDRTGRHLRRLALLWRDLTTAVPEVVLPAGVGRGRDPESRLYRMRVEITDALLQLRPHLSVGDGPESSVETYATQLALAARARAEGHPPVGAQPSHRRQMSARDKTSELGHLLDLARHWPKARASVSGRARVSRQ
ncbi:MAB_1171c family putative transporter [Nocardia sp. XZ_19_369]|uniref:MAB_1171c family putative transporter n=1 Tax=Nocardia sp. XZ_19_369 TaxID=2769487 RepID=UPI0018905120|nr:MAB_1171c family putative transporter [Nocardia sp. XZ_19_369]